MNGLQKSSSGKISATTFDATKATNVAKVKEFGFDTHGLVVRNKTGKLIHSENGHSFGLLSIDGWVTKAKASNH